jgi:vesicular inhibitory amino acid transporter
MSPWGGHSVFPNIYRDMRHPYKYRGGVDITYAFTCVLDLGMAVIGILMFGDAVRDEITSNILVTDGYPKAMSFIMVVCIAIIPLTKVPLNARPIVSTVEILTGLDSRALAQSSSMVGMSGFNRGLLKAAIRIVTVLAFVGIAIVFPSFDRIMTLLGSVCCFTICIILPLAFHLKLFWKDIGKAEKVVNWVLIIVSSFMAVVSTVFACLPKEMIGA